MSNAENKAKKIKNERKKQINQESKLNINVIILSTEMLFFLLAYSIYSSDCLSLVPCPLTDIFYKAKASLIFLVDTLILITSNLSHTNFLFNILSLLVFFTGCLIYTHVDIVRMWFRSICVVQNAVSAARNT